MRDSTIQRAQGHWKYILPELGVDIAYLRNEHGPCPTCGGQDRFRFDDKDGSGSWYCSGCDPQAGYGIHLAMNVTGMSMPEVSAEIDKLLGVDNKPEPQQPAPPRDPKPALQRMAKCSAPLGAEIGPVRLYLKSRGLKPARETRGASWSYWEGGQKQGTYPCMVHLVHDPDGRPATWHVTYLTQQGQKAEVKSPKKLMTPSRPWKGGAVRLNGMPTSGWLGVAEGIETALACTGDFPVWAALNAQNLADFEPPEGVTRLVIYADNDGTFTGQAAAYELARRMKVKRKLEVVEVNVPPMENTDWNDECNLADLPRYWSPHG